MSHTYYFRLQYVIKNLQKYKKKKNQINYKIILKSIYKMDYKENLCITGLYIFCKFLYCQFSSRCDFFGLCVCLKDNKGDFFNFLFIKQI